LEEAYLARAHLLDAGIEVWVADQSLVSMVWHLDRAVGGVKLQVRERDAPQAARLLADARQPVAPATESTPEETAERAMRAAAFGWLAPPLHLYSLWLVGRLLFAKVRLSIVARKRLAWACFLDGPVLLWLTWSWFLVESLIA
jgi:hypothetical protein